VAKRDTIQASEPETRRPDTGALDDPAIAIASWAATPLAGGSDMFANTYRVSGIGADVY
jgi:hypothetical protein